MITLISLLWKKNNKYYKPEIAVTIVYTEEPLASGSDVTITVGGNPSNDPLTPSTQQWQDNSVDHDFYDL